jgi:hypothetical protein
MVIYIEMFISVVLCRLDMVLNGYVTLKRSLGIMPHCGIT